MGCHGNRSALTAQRLVSTREVGKSSDSSRSLSTPREGLPYGALSALISAYDLDLRTLPSSRTPARTLARRKRERRLHPDESDRLFRVARIATLAEEGLGGREQAARWLKRPNRALGNAVPLDHLDTDLGAREVEDILARISHGVYS
jgi:putative toxin-antitoxin system antitoxin component (TIGR02293 family)